MKRPPPSKPPAKKASEERPPARPWFETWFDENYLRLYAHRNEEEARKQIALMLRTLKFAASPRILDAACGTGRHVKLLTEKGLNAEGLDLSPTLIKIGKKAHPHLRLNQGDMRTFQGQFDAILLLFTSFGYLPHQENKAVLSHLFKQLQPGGYLWLDYLNAAQLKNSQHHPLTDTWQRLGQGKFALEERRINQGRIEKRITFLPEGRTYLESVALYPKAELVALLQQAGFVVEEVFGDYGGSNWHPNRPRAILVGKKR